jgi:hypothetical protein
MHGGFNSAPDWAQSSDLTNGARGTRLGQGERTLAVRLITPADIDDLDEIGETLADIPPGYVDAIVEGRNSYTGCIAPVAVPQAEAEFLSVMSGAEIVIRLGRKGRDFLKFLDNATPHEVACVIFGTSGRRSKWLWTIRRARGNRAERRARVEALRRRCSTRVAHDA